MPQFIQQHSIAFFWDKKKEIQNKDLSRQMIATIELLPLKTSLLIPEGVCSIFFSLIQIFIFNIFFLSLQWFTNIAMAPKNTKNRINCPCLLLSELVLVCMCLNMYKICISASRKRHDNHSYFQASTLQFATAPYLDLQEINSLHFQSITATHLASIFSH